MSGTSVQRYGGREFTSAEIDTIRCLIAQNPEANRAGLSRLVSRTLGWLKPNGGLKEMSCRVSMLRMHRAELIHLPPPRKVNGNGKRYRRRTTHAETEEVPIFTPAGEFDDLRLELVRGRTASHLWNEYIDRYHYLGYQPLRGDQLRYFALEGGRILALLGFCAAVWKTAPRDNYIGWTIAQRKQRLHLVTNNARFLILPWIHSKNLASRILSRTTRRLAMDWKERYGYRPVLVETFVECSRFHGTCYKAANWLWLGQTTGRGRLDIGGKDGLPIKSVLVYPLQTNFRQELCI